MSSFALDLDCLRGFGPMREDETVTLSRLSPLERLLPHARPLKPSDVAALLFELVEGEAVLLGAIMQTAEGTSEWSRWVASGEADSWKGDPPPSQVRIARSFLSAIHVMELLAMLDRVGVHRVHRAHFLRYARRHNQTLATQFRDAFQRLEVVQRPLLSQNLRLTLSYTQIPAFSNQESLIYGAIGLKDTIDRFELGRARVSTYARAWIRARKSRASANWVNALRDPGHTAERRMKTRAVAATIRASGVEPTAAELVERVDALESNRVAEVYRGRPLGARLAAVGLSEAPRLLDLTTEESLHDRERGERLRLIWSVVQEEIAQLPDRQAFIAATRLGLLGGGNRTLAAIGQTFGVSRERIRQLEHSAFETIRSRVLRRL